MDSKINIAIIARIKHGDIYNSIKRRGWNVIQAARFIGVSLPRMYDMVNLRTVPRLNIEQEMKLAELTGKTFDQLFPAEFNAREFLDGRRELVAFRDLDPRTLVSAGFRALPVPLSTEEEDMIVVAEQLLERLTPRERDIFRRCVVENQSLVEAGSELHLDKERVRQIKLRALSKLRHLAQDRDLVKKLTPI